MMVAEHPVEHGWRCAMYPHPKQCASSKTHLSDMYLKEFCPFICLLLFFFLHCQAAPPVGGVHEVCCGIAPVLPRTLVELREAKDYLQRAGCLVLDVSRIQPQMQDKSMLCKSCAYTGVSPLREE